jgi:hypothetical protein
MVTTRSARLVQFIVDERAPGENESEIFRMNIDPRPISEPAPNDSPFRKWLKRIGSFIWSVLSLPFT